MFVYLSSEPGLWTVGHYAPDGSWVAESDHATDEVAAERCHWLNGGSQTQELSEGSWERYRQRYGKDV